MDEPTVKVEVETPPQPQPSPQQPVVAQVPEQVLAELMQLQQRLTETEARLQQAQRDMVEQFQLEWIRDSVRELRQQVEQLTLRVEAQEAEPEEEEEEAEPEQDPQQEQVPVLPQVVEQPVPEQAGVQPKKRPWWL